jgi:HAD superfamily hydrolase (TIGR01509 family)
MMPDFDLVIFDCDGVLVDSEALSGTVFTETLKTFDIEIAETLFFERLIGKSFESAVATVEEVTGKMPPPAFKDTLRDALLKKFESDLRPVDGIPALLSVLKTKRCVATNSDPVRASRSLAYAGLDSYFGSHLYSATMVGKPKPAPDLFLFAASQCATPPDRCVVIDDSAFGLMAAKAAGMTAWHFKGGSHFKTGYQVDPAIERDASYSTMDDVLKTFQSMGMA